MDETKSNVKNDHNEVVCSTSAAPAAIPVETATFARRQSADIFKMNIDCYEEAFDFLPLADLFSIGKTCKLLYQVVGYIFQQTYSANFYNDTVGLYPHIGLIQHLKKNRLSQFLTNLSLWNENKTYRLIEIATALSKMRRLKKIELRFFEITTTEMESIVDTLNQVETLHLQFCKFNGDLDASVFSLCPNLKYLSIGEGNYEESGIVWFARQYPTLQRFDLSDQRDINVGIPTFLELNPNIRKLGINGEWLLKDRDWVLTTNVTLDDLAIELFFIQYEDFDRLESICYLLNELYARGFYKRLKLYFHGDIVQQEINRIAVVSGNALVKFYLDTGSQIGQPITVSVLKNLDELCIVQRLRPTDPTIPIDWMDAAMNLTNLKRIHLYIANFDHILLLMRRSVGLKKIRADYILNGIHFNEDKKVVDLRALNKERKQLPNVQKVTLYVKETIYLATKWTLTETDFSLIQLRRIESYEWDHDFSWNLNYL